MDTLSRRSLLSLAAAAPLASSIYGAEKIPVGLELYSVRNELKQNQTQTLRAVAQMGYEIVEFFGPYYEWSIDQTKDVRKLLDELGIRCLSTHNDAKNFQAGNLARTAELNHLLGAKYVVMASAGRPQGVAGWTAVAETPTAPPISWKSGGLRAGYHNHELEFLTLDED